MDTVMEESRARMPAHAPVSVIVPCFNAAAYLGAALESIVTQDPTPAEIIVVDDGSSDASAGIAQDFGRSVCVIRQANAGIAASRNRGVDASTATLLAFLDADDLWPAGSLARRIAVLATRPDAECVYGAIEQFVTPELDAEARTRLAPIAATMPGRFAGSMLVRRAAFTRVGPFDASLRIGETLDWVARAAEAGLVGVSIPEVVLRRRIHGANTVMRERQRQNDYIRALHASLLRRRARIDGDD